MWAGVGDEGFLEKSIQQVMGGVRVVWPRCAPSVANMLHCTRYYSGVPILRPSGLTPLQLETLFLTNLLEVRTNRDLGVLKGYVTAVVCPF